MLITTHNVNGIRAALRRGYADWLTWRRPDVAVYQEVRCPVAALPHAFPDYHVVYDAGTRAGRNGVAIATREPVEVVRTWGGAPVVIAPDGSVSTDAPHATPSGDDLLSLTSTPDLATWSVDPGCAEFAEEGRYIEVDLADAPVTIACVYIPKGDVPADINPSASPEAIARWEHKTRFLEAFARHIEAARAFAAARGREFLVMGDFNIAHTPLDLTNWRANGKMSGFLPAEREWMSALLEPATLIDVVRAQHPETPGPYSWWTWRGQAFNKDVGWRIDYHLATPELAASATEVVVDKESSFEARLSDHCPVGVRYAF